MAVYTLHRDYRIIRMMKAIDVHLKVELDLEDTEDPKRFAEELCKALKKIYGVRRAEVSTLHDVSVD